MIPERKRFVIVAVAVVATGVLAFAGMIGLRWLRQNSVVREYRAQGFQMVEGCNAGAAVKANGQVYTIKQRLEEFTDSHKRNTNMMVQLQNALVIAQEKHRVLSDDCRTRGHCENHPWKTNWAAIKQTLTASQWTYW